MHWKFDFCLYSVNSYDVAKILSNIYVALNLRAYVLATQRHLQYYSAVWQLMSLLPTYLHSGCAIHTHTLMY